MRQNMAQQLHSLGAKQLVMAKDGVEVLKVLRSQTNNIIRADWNMPVMHGLDLLKAVRADKKLCCLPFLMITAETERPFIEQAVANGVTSLVLKPCAPNQSTPTYGNLRYATSCAASTCGAIYKPTVMTWSNQPGCARMLTRLPAMT